MGVSASVMVVADSGTQDSHEPIIQTASEALSRIRYNAVQQLAKLAKLSSAAFCLHFTYSIYYLLAPG